MYILVYVDDIVFTGSHPLLVNQITTNLATRFSIKDLGNLSYFLGIEAHRTSKGLHLMQRKYINDLLTKTNMLAAKPVLTPMSSHPRLTLNSGSPFANPSEYCIVVGSLQYLVFTRPDIAYAVNNLSQFMHKPTDDHWQAVKRVLRYLAGTAAHGIFLRPDSPLSLHAFSDADWTGDTDDYVSTNEYIIYLGFTPISWSAKKQKASLDLQQRLSTEPSQILLPNSVGYVLYSLNLVFNYLLLR